MSETKHTALVYDVNYEGDVAIHVYDRASGRKGALVAKLVGKATDDGVMDLALLFQGAPELLETLEDLVPLAEAAMREAGGYDVDAELAEARAAIAEAKGETARTQQCPHCAPDELDQPTDDPCPFNRPCPIHDARPVDGVFCEFCGNPDQKCCCSARGGALMARGSGIEARLARLEEEAARAAAELRHAYRDKVIDRNLVARAIEILERALVALDGEVP